MVLSQGLASDIVRWTINQMTGESKPLIFSSFLLRAIQTALYIFPNSAVHPIPYVAEKGDVPANTPLGFEVQLQRLWRADFFDFDLDTDRVPQGGPPRNGTGRLASR